MRTNRGRGDRPALSLFRFAIATCGMLHNVHKPQTGSCFQKLLLHQLARQSAWRGFRGPPSTCNALMFTEAARRRFIYWLASSLAQNSHL